MHTYRKRYSRQDEQPTPLISSQNSAARKSKPKKADDDAESMLPDDFTIVGSEDGETVFGGWDDNGGSVWATGNENGIEEEEDIDDEAVLTMLETSLGKVREREREGEFFVFGSNNVNRVCFVSENDRLGF